MPNALNHIRNLFKPRICAWCKKSFDDRLKPIKCPYCKKSFCENCVRPANHSCKKAKIRAPPGGLREVHHADGRVEASGV